MLKNQKLKIIFLFLILFLGFFVRWVNYDVWPREGATFDEYAWPWLGISLFQKGIPMSWSPHRQYQDYEIKIFREAPFRIVRPYLEHPPLFGLISGGYALLSGAKDMFDADHLRPQNLRKLSLFLGTLSILMVYLLVSKIYDFKMGFLSALLYATIPSISVGSRLLQNENFMIPVWLLTLWLLAYYLENKKRKLLWLIAFISAIMLWAKIPWGVIGISVVGILFYQKRYKDCLPIIGSLIFSLGLFFLYGYHWDWKIFIGLWGLQLSRYDIGLQTILSIFTHPYLTDRILIDGWIYFGWLAIFIILKNFKKQFFLTIPFLTYFFFYIWAVPGVQMQGWYRYPFYPFLIIATAYLILQLIKVPSLLGLIFQFVVGSTAFRSGWEPTFGISFGLFRALLIFWSLPILLYLFVSRKFKKLYQISFLFWLAIFILLNLSSARLYNEQ